MNIEQALDGLGEREAEKYAFCASALLVDPVKFYAYLAGFKRAAEIYECVGKISASKQIQRHLFSPDWEHVQDLIFKDTCNLHALLEEK